MINIATFLLNQNQPVIRGRRSKGYTAETYSKVEEQDPRAEMSV